MDFIDDPMDKEFTTLMEYMGDIATTPDMINYNRDTFKLQTVVSTNISQYI